MEFSQTNTHLGSETTVMVA